MRLWRQWRGQAVVEENGNGVVLKLQGKGQGAALNLGADAVHIAYK